ncbi:hypothetical protein ACJJTC_012108 [Scirpophaga incertulas]
MKLHPCASHGEKKAECDHGVSGVVDYRAGSYIARIAASSDPLDALDRWPPHSGVREPRILFGITKRLRAMWVFSAPKSAESPHNPAAIPSMRKHLHNKKKG